MKVFAVALAGGAVAAFTLAYAATTWSVHAKLERAAATVSNRAAKGDRLDVTRVPTRPAERALTSYSLRLPSGEGEVALRKSAGPVVYRSDLTMAETTVTRGAEIPTGVLSDDPETSPHKPNSNSSTAVAKLPAG